MNRASAAAEAIHALVPAIIISDSRRNILLSYPVMQLAMAWTQFRSRILRAAREAALFAHRVIRELIHDDEKLYTMWMVEITARDRKVATFSFVPEARAVE